MKKMLCFFSLGYLLLVSSLAYSDEIQANWVDLGAGSVLSLNGQIADTTDHFYASITVNGQAMTQEAVTLNLTDTVDIQAHIVPSAEQNGKTVEGLIYAEYRFLNQANYQFGFLLNQQNQIEEWDRNPSTLVSRITGQTLSDTWSFPLYQGQFVATGGLKLFFGYRLSDGTVHFNATHPLILTIVNYPLIAGAEYVYTADFDGDGQIESLQFTATEYSYWQVADEQTLSKVWSEGAKVGDLLWTYRQQLQIADTNQDGKDELIFYQDNQRYRIQLMGMSWMLLDSPTSPTTETCATCYVIATGSQNSGIFAINTQGGLDYLIPAENSSWQQLSVNGVVGRVLNIVQAESDSYARIYAINDQGQLLATAKQNESIQVVVVGTRQDLVASSLVVNAKGGFALTQTGELFHAYFNSQTNQWITETLPSIAGKLVAPLATDGQESLFVLSEQGSLFSVTGSMNLISLKQIMGIPALKTGVLALGQLNSGVFAQNQAGLLVRIYQQAGVWTTETLTTEAIYINRLISGETGVSGKVYGVTNSGQVFNTWQDDNKAIHFNYLHELGMIQANSLLANYRGVFAIDIQGKLINIAFQDGFWQRQLIDVWDVTLRPYLIANSLTGVNADLFGITANNQIYSALRNGNRLSFSPLW
ncbi:hypothetical protein BegalDRAFT_0997 [Beggiatoa alba B18LD]|uniref:FG-GAP repeat protein n=2 Tax=Beggiatoa alba TaxID=1022 RepID=I3CE58_9GAMM|nr:hypothetical protein BegalDRAFT_0997 [Beggiatoa alba B18LD]